MVHNITRLVKLPFGGHTLNSRNSTIKGRGMGSVLLSTGGAGAGSSYMDMDDYIHTTGIDPYARKGVTRGRGVGSLSARLSKMEIVPSSGRRKNITMSM